MPDIDRMTTIQGLPVDQFLPAGLHKVSSLFFRNVMYCPAYIAVEDDPNYPGDTRITHIGMQTHLMQPV